jgi:nicotinamide-nucleotide amidase
MKTGVIKGFEYLVEILKSRKIKISAAESCTGGLFMSMITQVPGSSEVFGEGFVTYSNESKFRILGVNPHTIAVKGAVSEETVSEMLDGLLCETKADVVCAVSGIAGPEGGTIEKPVGTVVTGVRIRSGSKNIVMNFFEGNRNEIRIKSCETLKDQILEIIKSNGK